MKWADMVRFLIVLAASSIEEMKVAVRYGRNTVEILFGLKALIPDLDINLFSPIGRIMSGISLFT